MQVRISVRNLVEFILRSGDLDNRIGKFADQAMSEGSRIHRMIQKRAGADYQAEVPLKFSYVCDDCEIVVEGRADGIIHNDDGVTIDEIKSTYGEINHMKEAHPIHVAQAKFYAYIIAQQEELTDIRVRMTYVNIETEDIRYFHYNLTKMELDLFVNDVCGQYAKWAKLQSDWAVLRDESIATLEFPFDYRDGQSELVTHVYHTIYHKRKLFLEAPTGVGKTISTMFPAVKAMGQEMAKKIFYLTAKTITRTVADDTIKILRNNGLKFKSIILTAKEKICFTGETLCNPDDCPYAKGHFDRVNDAVYAMLTEQDAFSRETVEEYARRFEVCPFEMGLDASLFCDAIIGDYNYAFDPHARLKRFFADGKEGEYIFLIDEAHNLVDRAREMYSAVIIKEDFLRLKHLIAEKYPLMAKKFEKCNKEMLNLKRDCDKYVIEPQIGALILAATKLYSEIEDYLNEDEKGPEREELLDFYFTLSSFLEIYDGVDENYITYTSYDDAGNFYVKLFCVNPRTKLGECMLSARSTILFSATLLPIQYYKYLLGGDKEDYEVYADSVFDPNKRGLFIGGDVTTKYTRRTDREFQNIAEYIHNIVSNRHGNYMVFFPSYSFMMQVYNIYADEFMDKEHEECLLQNGFMKEEEREEFLNRFRGNTDLHLNDTIQMDIEVEDESILIGFCVMGGVFGEGIDLKNDSLIGAIIVGTGLPQVCLEREIIKDYFDSNGGNGFDFAYRYPGMNKVLQAAGRVIRTVDDVGIVALLDERFLQSAYQKMFPREWEHFETTNLSTIAKRVERFWDEWLF